MNKKSTKKSDYLLYMYHQVISTTCIVNVADTYRADHYLTQDNEGSYLHSSHPFLFPQNVSTPMLLWTILLPQPLPGMATHRKAQTRATPSVPKACRARQHQRLLTYQSFAPSPRSSHPPSTFPNESAIRIPDSCLWCNSL